MMILLLYKQRLYIYFITQQMFGAGAGGGGAEGESSSEINVPAAIEAFSKTLKSKSHS